MLYKQVSSYLQRDDLLAIKSGARHLVTLVIRKILASSSTAIRGTLETMIHRLESKMPVLDALTDYENYDDYSDEEGIDDEDTIDPQALQAEIDQLKNYKTLAASITKNAKAEALLRVLDRAFTFTAELGGLRKAVIFTESVRTQTGWRNCCQKVATREKWFCSMAAIAMRCRRRFTATGWRNIRTLAGFPVRVRRI